MKTLMCVCVCVPITLSPILSFSISFLRLCLIFPSISPPPSYSLIPLPLSLCLFISFTHWHKKLQESAIQLLAPFCNVPLQQFICTSHISVDSLNIFSPASPSLAPNLISFFFYATLTNACTLYPFNIILIVKDRLNCSLLYKTAANLSDWC